MSQNLPTPTTRRGPQALRRSTILRQALLLARANAAAARNGSRPPAGRLIRGPWRGSDAA
jgi:hypothetical protein